MQYHEDDSRHPRYKKNKVTTTDVHTLQIESMGNAQGRIWDTQQGMVDRLSNIEGDLGHIEADVNDLGDLWCDSNTSINNRLDHIEECLTNVEKSEALVKWENLYTRLWNIEARLSKLEEDRHGID